MPLNVEVRRQGDTLKLRWDHFALSAVFTAAFKEGMPEQKVNDDLTFGGLAPGQWVDFSLAPVYWMEGIDLLDKGEQTLKMRHEFKSMRDDEEVKITLLPGDVLKAWRSHK